MPKYNENNNVKISEKKVSLQNPNLRVSKSILNNKINNIKVLYLTLIKWTDSFSVNVTEIDMQHKKLVEMINKLYDAMKVGKSRDVMGETLNDLISYTATHFKTEEKYFDLYKYPEKETHKAEHEKFVETVTKFKTDFDAGNATISIEVMNFLREWLTKHINGSDKKYTKCFNDHGLK